MKKLLVEINETFRQNKFHYLVVILFLCIGIVFGVCMVKYMNQSDKNDLITYFNMFMESTRNESTNYRELLISVTLKVILIIIPIIMLSFTLIGAPLILFIDFIKGFTLGYTFAFLINTLENKGLLLALASIIPQNIIYIPCLIFLSIISIKTSNYRFKRRFLKINNMSLDYENLKKNMALVLILFVVGIILETFMCPSIIRLVVR